MIVVCLLIQQREEEEVMLFNRSHQKSLLRPETQLYLSYATNYKYSLIVQSIYASN